MKTSLNSKRIFLMLLIRIELQEPDHKAYAKSLVPSSITEINRRLENLEHACGDSMRVGFSVFADIKQLYMWEYLIWAHSHSVRKCPIPILMYLFKFLSRDDAKQTRIKREILQLGSVPMVLTFVISSCFVKRKGSGNKSSRISQVVSS